MPLAVEIKKHNFYIKEEDTTMTDPKFMTPPHRRAYLTHLNRCKVMDNYPEYTRQLDDVVIDDARN